MSLWGAWILVPVALTLLLGGCGLAAERLLRTRVPGALVPTLGLAAVVAVAGVLTIADATAELATPAVWLLAAVGLALGRPWSDPRLAQVRWPLLAALLAFAVVAWPSLASGQGLLPGYVKLDDSATWIALSDQALTHGRNLDGAGVGSYAETLRAWMGTDYPIGAFLPLGIAAKSTGVDAIAVYAPLLALLVATAALGLGAVVTPLVRDRRLALACGIVGVQASVFLGYVQWGGLKEATMVALLPLLAWGAGDRRIGPLVLGAAAVTGVLGVNGLLWAGPALLAGGVGAVAGAWPLRRPALRDGALALVLLGVLSLPAIVTSGFLRFTRTGGGASALTNSDLGNLVKPLPFLQGLGLWPVGDFRLEPDPRRLAVLLALLGIAAAIGAAGLALRARQPSPAVLLGLALLGSGVAFAVGSPWVDAKALAMLAPAVLALAAALAARGLTGNDRLVRAAGGVGALVLLGGCAWSTVAIARDVQIAPRARLAELREVADRVGSTGPLVQLDFEIYGDRHLLRRASPEGATDLRTRQVAKADGTLYPSLATAEVDALRTSDLWVYRTIVRRRTPVGSRPPAAFRPVFLGRYWEAWERPADAPQPLAHLPLGDDLHPDAVPSCERVRVIARTPGARVIAAAPARGGTLIGLDAAGADVPLAWRARDGVRPVTDGDARIPISVERAGRYRLWVGGSAFGRLEVLVDGRSVGVVRHELSHAGQWIRFGASALRPGRHVVTLRASRGPWWRAGRQAPDRQSVLGPLAVTPVAGEDAPPVVRLAPRDAVRRLCDGRAWDWIEALER